MEFRYIITTAVAIITLQLLIFNLGKTLQWLFNLKRRTFILITTLSYISANSIAIIHITKILPAFRLIAFILTLLLFAFFIRFITACLYFIFKQFINKNKLDSGLRVLYPFAFIGLISLSIYNAYTPQIIHYTITLDKPLAKPLRIGVASDFHLGKYFGGKQLDKLAEIMQKENVDLILLPGDIMDDNISAYLAENMQAHLAKLQAPLGVYATLGNHDFFEDKQAITREITKAGIKVLADETLNVDNQFILLGRNDNLAKHRPTTAALLAKVDTHLPIFILDHRPNDILLHSKLPIDIQVSGHTHKGQIFPANIITALIYDLDYGYRQINQGHFFVTSGYGFWGVPMRLGSQSEVFIIDVKGK